MNHLRLEKTVYAIQRTIPNNLETTETETEDKNIGTNYGSETYKEGRNSELICQIGKRMS